MSLWSSIKSTGFVLVLAVGLLVSGVSTSFAQNVSFTAAPTVTAQNGTIAAAVGDFNGDGRQDLAVSNRLSNTISILLGNGNGTFGSPVHFSVGSEPDFIAVADFNADGHLDLAVANVGSNNVSILLGNGDGTFALASNPTVGTRPVSIAVGDFNADGHLDLAVASFGIINVNNGSVSILLGNGNGTFGPATNLAAGINPEGVAIGDFNGNGIQDLAAANGNSDNISIFLGVGDGTFGAPTNLAAGAGPASVAIGDFNGDGIPDLAVPNQFSNTITILLGQGNGNFSPAPAVAVVDRPLILVVADFNGDGRQDLAVTNFDGSRISVLLGNGNGTFSLPAGFSVGDSPHTPAVGDFNNDGKPDLAVANRDSNNVSILLNTTDTTASAVRLSNISTRGSVLTGDNVMIGGFIIQGATPKTVLIRGRGPSMGGAPFAVPGTLANPFVQLFSGSNMIAQNNDWQDAPSCTGFACGDAAQIIATGLDPCQPNPGQSTSPPGCAQESAIHITLPPGAYTAILSGVGGGTGVGLIEVFELDGDTNPTELVNISTRGRVATGDNVMIGGFIIQGAAPKTVLIRGRGPSMGGAPFAVPGTLANPFVQLFSGSNMIAQNNDWQDAPSCTGFACGGAAQITATGLDPCQPNPGQSTAPPGCAQESAIYITLPPGAYTAIMSGVGGGTGVGLIEVFEVD